MVYSVHIPAALNFTELGILTFFIVENVHTLNYICNDKAFVKRITFGKTLISMSIDLAVKSSFPQPGTH